MSLKPSICDKYEYKSQRDSVRDRDWAIGSKKKLEKLSFFIDKEWKLIIDKVTYSPALMKIFDEIFVNACDNYIKNPTRVKKIKVIFCDGKFQIWNDGPGIEVEKHAIASELRKKDTYVPTFIFSELFQGSNKTREGSIVGGTNGIGAKATNCCSVYFEVETADQKNKFKQVWLDGNLVEHDPVVAPSIESFTKITFIPDYPLFESSKEDLETLDKLVRFRLVMGAIYIPNCEISYNGESIKHKTTEDVAKMLYTETIAFSVKNAHKNCKIARKWNVSVVLDESKKMDISNINGILVEQGAHFKTIRKQIKEATTALIKAKVGKATTINKQIGAKIDKFYSLIIDAQIPNPGWAGQRKDVMESAEIDVTIDKKTLAQIAEYIAGKVAGVAVKKKQTKEKVDNERYITCPKAGSAKSADAKLLLVEGLSALVQIQMGVSKMSDKEYFGILSTGGVTVNVTKQIKDLVVDDHVQVVKSDMLEKNRFFTELQTILGLDQTLTYDASKPGYAKEMKTLNYGSVIACVDQDVDGKGNILPLVLNMFATFWPKLLEQGYLKWFMTAIARAYPKCGGNIINFYNIIDLNKWEHDQGDKKANFEIKYYKGLATHDGDEIQDMFNNFYKNTYVFSVDKETPVYFDIFYGKDAEKRKVILRKPVPNLHDNPKLAELQQKTRVVSCTDLLKYEANEFHHDRLGRGLPHEIDGLNEAGRKIIDGLIKMFKNKNIEVRVSQAAGYVSQHELYHHGESSLNNSIKCKGFITTGGVQLPLFLPKGFFGNRNSPVPGNERYIHMRPLSNITDKLFPPIDYQILSFVFDGNDRAEPKYFVPIIPLGVIETICLPATGWKVATWARDIFDVIDYTRALIAAPTSSPSVVLRPCAYSAFEYAFKGRFETINGKDYCIGDYSLHKVGEDIIVVIRELPLKTWTNDYVIKMRKKPLVSNVIDNSGDKINIHIYLTPGALQEINEKHATCDFDGIEKYFELYTLMEKALNYINTEGGVTEYKTYEAIVHKWFASRKLLYKQRVDRAIVIETQKHRFLANIVRYIEESEQLAIAKKKSAVQITILDSAKFDKFNKSKLNNPKFTPTADLEKAITVKKATFDYLLDLPDSQKSLEYLIKYKAQMETCLANIDTLKADPEGLKVWLTELEELRLEILEGARTNWQYKDYGKFKF
jgi:Type IIA topoisomerase (DNA gyrase/topo II, topoisomerase IV), B subunit